MIDPFDIVSGKVVQNENGTFWFKEAGNNLDEDGWPIWENLHKEKDQPTITEHGLKWFIMAKKLQKLKIQIISQNRNIEF